jgi:hypothetical protein
VGQETEDDQGTEEGHHTRIWEAQGWKASALDDGGNCQGDEGLLSETGVVAQFFDIEETSVGLEADLPESGKINEPFRDAKVEGIVGGELGAKSLALFVILLQG